MHLHRDVQLLQKTIREMLLWFSNLPVGLLTEEIRQELNHVEKMMKQSERPSGRHHVTKKQKRPALNIEDPTVDPLDFGNWDDDLDA